MNEKRLEEQFERTRLEILRDFATSLNGQKTILEGVVAKCEETFGKDYGLQQVIALIEFSLSDMIVDIERLK